MIKLTSVSDIEELARAVELDEVLKDGCLQELTVQLPAPSMRIPTVELTQILTSATPLTLRLPMTARLAMRTFCGKPST